MEYNINGIFFFYGILYFKIIDGIERLTWYHYFIFILSYKKSMEKTGINIKYKYQYLIKRKFRKQKRAFPLKILVPGQPPSQHPLMPWQIHGFDTLQTTAHWFQCQSKLWRPTNYHPRQKSKSLHPYTSHKWYREQHQIAVITAFTDHHQRTLNSTTEIVSCFLTLKSTTKKP